MDGTRPTLPRRAIAVLHARQYVVFFAIALYALDFAVPVLARGLYRPGSIHEMVAGVRSPLADAAASRSLLIAAVAGAHLVVSAWLRAGYIRSLVGSFHPGPRDAHQFVSLLAFQLFLALVGAGAAGLISRAGDHVLAANLIAGALMLVYLAVMYADYVIVISGVGPLRAVALSGRTVVATLVPSLLILLVVTVAGETVARLWGDALTGVAAAVPLVVLDCAVMGSVVFVADVALVVLYLDAVERGRVRPDRQSPSGEG